MRPANCRGKKADALRDVRVSHHADVELPVGDAGVRCDSERSTEISPVGHREHENFRLRAASFDRDGHALVRKKLRQRGVDVEGVATQELDARGCFQNRSVEAKTATIDEVSPIDAPDVDSRRTTRRNEIGELLGAVLGDAERFGEVVSGACRDDCERTVSAGFHQRVCDAAAGPVSTHDDNSSPTRGEGLESNALFVAPLTCLPDVTDAKRGEGLPDLMQSSPRGALSRGGVEDQPRDSSQKG